MVSPWAVWCEFVWLFCIAVTVFVDVMEAERWHTLFPNWADLTCGLTTLCAAMTSSTTIVFVVVYLYLSSITSMLSVICSLAATVVFLVDAVMQRQTFPGGYLCSLRGGLRTAEAFIACIILTAATDQFVSTEWFDQAFWMMCCSIAFAICLLVTVVIIVLNLLQLLQCSVSFRLSRMEFVFNTAAVLFYLLAVTLWFIYSHRQRGCNPNTHDQSSFADVNIVFIGATGNLVLYSVDLVLSCKPLEKKVYIECA